MKRFFISAMMFAAMLPAMAQSDKVITVSATAPSDRTDEPVVVSLKDYGDVKAAIVTDEGKEVPCQIDDLDGDDIADELCFVSDMKKGKKKTFKVQLKYDGEQKQYADRTYARLLLRNPKAKAKNKHDIYMQSMTVEKGVNFYSIPHQHGVVLESELIGVRVYFDHRQSLDLYGKKTKQLELKETQFYTDANQLAAGYGDDIFWCGQSFGLGALRGYDGQNQVMLEDIKTRTQSVITYGPVRAIVEIIDRQWVPSPGMKPVTMKTRYTVYAGHRDIIADISFSHPVEGYKFTTGFTNVKGSEEFSDKKGLRGCWGSDYAVGGKDTLTHKKETVGLGICIPDEYNKEELPANPDNYPYVVGTSGQTMRYYLTYCSDNETFGYHNAKDWFNYLKEWKKELAKRIQLTIDN